MTNTTRFRPTVNLLEAREVPAIGMGDLFNIQDYLADNPDVRNSRANAAAHFLQFGRAEGRDPGRFFDSRMYLDDNPDVRDARLNPLDHFLRFGQFEGRDPTEVFNTAAYLAANPDVAATVRARLMTAYEHFLRNGQFEDRSPGNGFNLGVYLDDNPDVRDAVERGLTRGIPHFVRFGFFEGRNKPMSQVVTLPPGQPSVFFTGTSESSEDRDFYAFRVPTDRDVRIDVTQESGDFVNVELEDPVTDADLLELEPQNGVTSGTATLEAGQFYILRVRAVGDEPAGYRVTITTV